MLTSANLQNEKH